MSKGITTTDEPLTRTDAPVSAEFAKEFGYFATFPFFKDDTMITVFSVQN
jgi:hypothetical protein